MYHSKIGCTDCCTKLEPGFRQKWLGFGVRPAGCNLKMPAQILATCRRRINGIKTLFDWNQSWGRFLRPRTAPPTAPAAKPAPPAMYAGDYHGADTTVHGKASTPFAEFFNTLGCPSDGNVRGQFVNNTRGSNYVGCTGDYMIGEHWQENRNTRGMFRGGWGGNPMTIPTDAWGQISAVTISDGQSNTMYISEIITTNHPAHSDWGVKTGITNRVPIHGYPAVACMRVSGPGGMFNRAVVEEVSGDGKGHRWGESRNPYSMFHAALPPNSPSCRDPRIDASSPCFAISASSYHPGGVNVSMVDGSVSFINNSIDCGDITKKLGEELGGSDTGCGHRWTGPSTVGVWGALATPAGKESASL